MSGFVVSGSSLAVAGCLGQESPLLRTQPFDIDTTAERQCLLAIGSVRYATIVIAHSIGEMELLEIDTKEIRVLC